MQEVHERLSETDVPIGVRREKPFGQGTSPSWTTQRNPKSGARGTHACPAAQSPLGATLAPEHTKSSREPPPLGVAIPVEGQPAGGFVGCGVMPYLGPKITADVHPPSPGIVSCWGLSSHVPPPATLSGPSHDPAAGRPHEQLQLIDAAAAYLTGTGHEEGQTPVTGCTNGVQPSEAGTQTPASHSVSGGSAAAASALASGDDGVGPVGIDPSSSIPTPPSSSGGPRGDRRHP